MNIVEGVVEKQPRPLWVCPRCGNRFANKNNWHSCNNYPIEAHFEGKPRAWELWLSFRAAVEAMGPVTLITTKSKVGFMTRVRFAGCEPRKDSLRAGAWLKRRVESPRVTRIEFIPPNNYIHYFDIRDPADLQDEEIQALLREAKAVGDQEHLRGRS